MPSLDLGTLLVRVRSKGVDETKNKLELFQKSLGGMKKVVSTVAKGLTAASAAIVAGFGAAVKVGSDFEAQMSTVSAISGASAEDMEKLGEKAKEMGIKTKFSATEAGRAMEYMAMAGWKTEEMLNGVEGIMNLAAASGEELAATSDIVTDAMTAFGMSADQSARFADVLAAASSNSNTNVGMMGETFKYVAPIAGAMKFSIEDTAVAIGLMANAGIKGSQAGTALRQTLSRLATPTKQSQIAIDELKLSVTNSDGSFKSFGTILEELRNKFGKLTDQQKATYATMLGGQEAMSGLLAIINASDADFYKLTAAINSSAGSAERMANLRLDNLQGQITLLKSSLEGLGVAVYDSKSKILTESVAMIKDYVGQMTEAFEQGGFSALIERTGSFLGEIVTKIAEYAPALMDAAKNMVSAFFNTIAENTGALTDAAFEIVQSIINAMMDLLPQMAQAGMNLIISLQQRAAEATAQVLPNMVDAILKTYETLIDNLDLLIESAIDEIFSLVDGLEKSIPILIEKAPGLIAKFNQAIVDNSSMMGEAGAQLILALLDGLVKSISVLIKNVPSIIWAIFNVITANIRIMVTAGTHLIEGLWQGINDCINWLGEKIWGVLQKIKSWFTGKDGFDEHSPSKWSEQVGVYLMQGLGNGIEKDMTAEEALKKKCNNLKNIIGSFSDSLKIDSEIADNEYSLWEIMHQNVTEEEKAAEQKKKLNQQSEIQVRNIELLNQAYVKQIELTGENSAEAKNYKNELIQAKKEYQEILNALAQFDQVKPDDGKLDLEIEKAKYSLWESRNQSLSEDEKEAKQKASLTKQMEYQMKAVIAANKVYEEQKAISGENSEQSKQLQKQLLQEAQAYNELSNALDQLNQKKKGLYSGFDTLDEYVKMLNNKNVYDQFINTHATKYRASGMTNEGIKDVARRISGYDGVTVYQNFYTKTATPSEVYNATKKAANDMEVAVGL